MKDAIGSVMPKVNAIGLQPDAAPLYNDCSVMARTRYDLMLMRVQRQEQQAATSNRPHKRSAPRATCRTNYAPLGKFSEYLRLMFVAWSYYCDAKDCGGNSNSDDSDAIDRSLGIVKNARRD